VRGDVVDLLGVTEDGHSVDMLCFLEGFLEVLRGKLGSSQVSPGLSRTIC
jgi:hypothetical protein